MKIPEIERDLKDRIHPRAVYHIMRLQEENIALQSQLNQCADVLVQVVQVIEELRNMSLGLKENWERSLRHDKSTEIVNSVLPDPE